MMHLPVDALQTYAKILGNTEQIWEDRGYEYLCISL